MQQIISKEKELEITLRKIQEKLIEVCKSNSQYCNHLTGYVLNRRGKRLRPLLVLLIAGKGREEEVLKVAVASELIHTASLVHDDIVDNSPLRRGVETLNNRWSNSVAVLVGDFLFAKAFQLLCDIEKGSILSYYTDAISQMSIGELEQLNNRFNPKKTEEQYYSEIYGKTGVLIATCCKGGAILRGVSHEDVENLTTYGRELGYAFQIIDDLLDIIGSQSVMGKPAFNDLKEGNVTLPIILLQKLMTNRGLVEEIIIERKFTDENLQFIYTMLKEYSIIELTLELAKGHIVKGLQALEGINGFDEKEKLKDIAQFVINRNY